MEPLLALVLLGLVLALMAAVVVQLVTRRLTRRREHDDTLRAGGPTGTSAQDAALRAQGSTAWMRIGGPL